MIATLTCSNRYRMKVVLPVLYCPTSITIGLVFNIECFHVAQNGNLLRQDS